MKVIIDGFENLVFPEENETLGEFLVQLEEWIKNNRKVIVKVKLEGKTLGEEQKKIIYNRKVNEFEVLEVFTANPWQWAIDSLEEMKVYLPEISSKMEKVGFFIQQGNYKKALSLLERYIGLWDEINETLRKIGNVFGLDYTRIFVNEEKASCKMKELLEYLEEAKRAIQENDLLALADILEFELAPRIKDERKLVQEIINVLKCQMN